MERKELINKINAITQSYGMITLSSRVKNYSAIWFDADANISCVKNFIVDSVLFLNELRTVTLLNIYEDIKELED